jgi:hypothetical protein
MEKMEPCVLLENCKMMPLLWKSSMAVPQKIELLYDPGILCLGIYENKLKRFVSCQKVFTTHVHSSMLNNSQRKKQPKWINMWYSGICLF